MKARLNEWILFILMEPDKWRRKGVRQRRIRKSEESYYEKYEYWRRFH
jgi:hypothetical protein